MNTKAIGAVIILVVIIGSFAVFFTGSKGRTVIYFTAESSLPNELLSDKSVDGSAVNIINVNQSYDVLFNIISLETKPTSYTYEISSELYNSTEKISISPRESKKIKVTLNPTPSQKWELVSNKSSKSVNILDITENSWIAERKDFQVLVKEDSLPTIVEEDYTLPISSDVAHFGRIFHINISLDELRDNPFEKEYISKDTGFFENTTSTVLVKLSVVGDKLSVLAESNDIIYQSTRKPFIVRVLKDADLEDIQIDEATGKEIVQTISFWYKIK